MTNPENPGMETIEPGGPIVVRRHFQGCMGLWQTTSRCAPYFYSIGTLTEVKRECRKAGYTSLEAYNAVSHRTTIHKTIKL